MSIGILWVDGIHFAPPKKPVVETTVFVGIYVGESLHHVETAVGVL